jgi:predicted phage terminase large subunit-like protein
MTNKNDPRDPLDGLPQAAVDAILRNDLAMFFRLIVWKVLKPHERLLWAPFLDFLCAILQAVAEGRINRLIITVPPRFGKSLAGSVALPAYFLGHNPAGEVMCVSYAAELSKLFGELTRKVMASPEYQRLFDTRLVSERASPMMLKTTAGGSRRATSIDGSATGMGAHLLIFDDPQKPGEVSSEAIRRATNSAYEKTFLSRQNDPRNVRIIIIQQRTHEDDFVGHVTDLGGDWTVVNLPAIAEADETWTYTTFLGEHTWTRREGESLHPERFPIAELLKIRADVGEATWSTQWQQRPTPAGGGIVQVKWFRRVPPDKMPALEGFERIIQSWDTANTTAEWSDYSVCTTWGILEGKLYLLNVLRKRLLFPDLKREVLQQATAFNATTVLIENRASGQQLLQDLVHDGYAKATGVDPDRDKEMRMASQTAIIENGFVYLPEDAHWAPEYLYELEIFPNGKYDDQVDSTSQLLAWYNNVKIPGWNVVEFYKQEAKRAGSRAVEEMWTLQIPDDQLGTTFYLMDGSMGRPDARGRIRTKRENAEALLRIPGFTRIEDEAA